MIQYIFIKVFLLSLNFRRSYTSYFKIIIKINNIQLKSDFVKNVMYFLGVKILPGGASKWISKNEYYKYMYNE